MKASTGVLLLALVVILCVSVALFSPYAITATVHLRAENNGFKDISFLLFEHWTICSSCLVYIAIRRIHFLQRQMRRLFVVSMRNGLSVRYGSANMRLVSLGLLILLQLILSDSFLGLLVSCLICVASMLLAGVGIVSCAFTCVFLCLSIGLSIGTPHVSSILPLGLSWGTGGIHIIGLHLFCMVVVLSNRSPQKVSKAKS